MNKSRQSYLESEIFIRLFTQDLIRRAVSVNSLTELDSIEELVSHDLLS